MILYRSALIPRKLSFPKKILVTHLLEQDDTHKSYSNFAYTLTTAFVNFLSKSDLMPFYDCKMYTKCLMIKCLVQNSINLFKSVHTDIQEYYLETPIFHLP